MNCIRYHPGCAGAGANVRVGALYAHGIDLHTLADQSAIALAVMATVAFALGWLVAGRVLRPLRDMTAAARAISEDNLNQRLNVPGPGDELKDLGDTIDGLLARLEAAFNAQRQFVASASHELRTPLTVERAMIEVALADPGATAATLRSVCQDVLETGQQQEKLIDALLTLARSQRGLDHRDLLDLAAITTRPWTPENPMPPHADWPSTPPSAPHPSSVTPACWSG